MKEFLFPLLAHPAFAFPINLFPYSWIFLIQDVFSLSFSIVLQKGAVREWLAGHQAAGQS